MDASLGTMRTMADNLGATVKVSKEVMISKDGITELLGSESPSLSFFASMPPVVSCTRDKAKPTRNQADIPPRSPQRSDSYAASSYGDADDDGAFMVFEGIDDLIEPPPSIVHQQILASDALRTASSIAGDGPPSLSHSPSPPSSRAGSLDTEILARRLPSQVALNMPDDKEEQDRLRQATRREMRKQWKQDRQKRKLLERAEQRNSCKSRQCRMHHGSLRIASSPQDQYLDALASLFGAASLDEEHSAVELPISAPHEERCTCQQPHGSRHHRPFRKTRRKQAAYSPTSVPLDSQNRANYFVQDPLSRDKWETSLPLNAARILGRKSAAAEQAADGVKRYAVECVITIIDDEPDAPSSMEALLPESITAASSYPDSNDSLSTAAKTPIDSKIDDELGIGGQQRMGKPLHRLQTIVDFDTVWDELGSQFGQ